MPDPTTDKTDKTKSTATPANDTVTTLPISTRPITALPINPITTGPVTLPVSPGPIVTRPITTLPTGTGPILTGPITVAGGDPSALSPDNPKITTTAPTSTVAVTVPNTSGQVTFSLVVTDNLGAVSQPATVTVTIQGPPVAVLTTDTPTVAAGGVINLSAAGSTSSGTISNFTFALVSPT